MNMNTEQILVFLEFLVRNGYSNYLISNVIAAVKSRLQAFGVDVCQWDSSRISYFCKALVHNAPMKVNLPKIINFNMLKQIILACDRFPEPVLFKAVYLMAFYSFLRISNLVPHSIQQYCRMEQLSRGDVFFAPPGLHILVKWTKTLQKRNRAVMLKLPTISQQIICPVSAIRQLLMATPGGQDAPLFQTVYNHKYVPLTDSKVRKHFKDVLTYLNWHTCGITFHSFRRSGASLAFQGDASVDSTKAHGTWSSDTVWRYIVQNQDGSSQVAATLAKMSNY